MKYRAQSAEGDFIFGKSNSFLIDSPECVAQAVRTRLLLMTGEWFLDSTEGTDYAGQILGYGTSDSRDIEVRSRILGTPGVEEITSYSSSVADRKFSVTCVIQTIYGGQATISITF